MTDKRKLIYSRQHKGLEWNQGKTSGDEISQMGIDAPTISLPSLKGYEKTDGVLSYNLICVISGGERKEKVFLRELIRQNNIHSLRVIFLSEEGQGLQPFQMQEVWTEIQNTGRITIAGNNYQLDAVDKTFLLSDVDEFYEQLKKIKEQHAECDTGRWIISNPCFEIWLYYCFKNNPVSDLNSLESFTVDKRSQEMKRIGNCIIPGGLNPLLAFENMENGIYHSLEHYAEDEHTIPVLYATQMHEVAQYLIDTMNRDADEYTNFISQKREWRKRMRG